MAQLKGHLLETLKDLTGQDFNEFKWHLESCTSIPESDLENADRPGTVNLLVRHLPQRVLTVTIEVLMKINRNDLALRLSQLNAEGNQR